MLRCFLHFLAVMNSSRLELAAVKSVTSANDEATMRIRRAGVHQIAEQATAANCQYRQL